ncbi:MAG: hypothetical protein WKF84_30630 [Pyrinomonadaceae bacterium]
MDARELTAKQSAAGTASKKDLVGVDVFLDWKSGSAEQLGEGLKKLATEGLNLQMIGNRGVEVWPQGMPETFCTDHWRCRYTAQTKGAIVTHSQITQLLQSLANGGFDFIKTENLYNFDGQPGYSSAS